MSPDKKSANAVGGKTARACDNCIRKSARWYCAADDAFLCQGCNASVHPANPLARRHERVRLKNASLKPTTEEESPLESSIPPWHLGFFTRKARTPRQAKLSNSYRPPPPPIKTQEEEEEPMPNPVPVVPEMGSEEASPVDENEEQILYRVPLFDPFDDTGPGFNFFSSSDMMDPEEFSVDIESLLGMEGLGLLGNCKEEDLSNKECCFGSNGSVKVEEEEEDVADCQVDQMTKETLMDWNFNYDSPTTGEEEIIKRKKLLRLNHEVVVTAWASQGSPWMTGKRPEFNADDCWPDFMGWWCPTEHHHHHQRCEEDVVGRGGGDGGREARVSRYREKRRTRMFSKKIRYEVRKLNAEKRPRMKGRFVKRASCFAASPPAAFPLRSQTTFS